MKAPTTKAVAFRNPYKFGEIQGFPVGSTWGSRRALCDDGIHAGLMKGINGREAEGAFSVVLSGGYEDDEDCGETILYTGEGGQERGVTRQVKDQVWKKGNRAMQISHLNNNPVRVIRGSGLDSPYAPLKGFRYDGLYYVQTAETVRGKNGFRVCKFKLVRCPRQLPLPASVRVPSSKAMTMDFTPENPEDESDQNSSFSDLEPFN